MPSVFANLGHLNLSRDPSLNQRRVRRDLVDMVSHITVQGRTHDARVINISAYGLMCRTDAPVTVGARVLLWLPILKDTRSEVRWVEEGRVGVEFAEIVGPRLYDAMLALIPPRQTGW